MCLVVTHLSLVVLKPLDTSFALTQMARSPLESTTISCGRRKGDKFLSGTWDVGMGRLHRDSRLAARHSRIILVLSHRYSRHRAEVRSRKVGTPLCAAFR